MSVLKTLHSDNSNTLIFAHIKVNSIRNKFDILSTQLKGNIDVLMVSETKIDHSFPVGNFLIDGFSILYGLDRVSNGGDIMFHVTEHIPSKFYVELNLLNEKWLM